MTPYNPLSYITGYAMENRDESDSQESVKVRALADLSKKIKVQVQSELIMQEEENQGEFRSAISSLTKSSVDTTINGADYLIHQDRKNSYALAYISIFKLQEQYSREAALLWTEILSVRHEADNLVEENRSQDALRLLYAHISSFYGAL
ncbi:MAG: hypothetical protein B6241_14735 [Spirochaetaceae bacterium 4572_59]|nr:MAG: hypothetical protein B6241_14735 [Spirochaetaceae bacterium 4572_59]